jgi:hypothetical protein
LHPIRDANNKLHIDVMASPTPILLLQFTNNRQAPVRSDGNGNGANKRRGRPLGRKSTGVTKPAQKPVPTAKPTTKPAKKPTKKKQAARAESEDELSLFVAEKPPSSHARKRIAPVDADEIAEDEPQSRKKYVQLEARTKRIPQEQIDTWPQLSAPVLEQIVAVMREAKKDIANTQRDERRVIAAHNALNPLVRTLSRQLATSRIPPHAKDMHFNIDKLTERIAHVSREVTTARHSKQLLSEQAKVAERQLLKDEQNLKELKTNAKKWRSEWKHQEKHGQVR